VMVALLVALTLGFTALPVLMSFLFVGFGFLGLVIPTTGVLALEEHGEIAGTASALMGTLQFVTASIAMVLASLIADGTALPMAAAIATSAVIAFLLAQLAMGRYHASIEAAAE
jgi:MFS transporter, DHA1 family, multidrug resistance protein